MKRSSNLQLVGLMLGWAGLRGMSAARSGVETASDPRALLLIISAVIVAGAALIAAVALWRGSHAAVVRTRIWAALLFGDLVLQEVVTPPISTWFSALILAGIACLLVAVVRNVQQYSAVHNMRAVRNPGDAKVKTV
jgi:hypothetical protein